MTMPYLCEFGNSGASVSHGHISSEYLYVYLENSLEYTVAIATKSGVFVKSRISFDLGR